MPRNMKDLKHMYDESVALEDAHWDCKRGSGQRGSCVLLKTPTNNHHHSRPINARDDSLPPVLDLSWPILFGISMGDIIAVAFLVSITVGLIYCRYLVGMRSRKVRMIKSLIETDMEVNELEKGILSRKVLSEESAVLNSSLEGGEAMVQRKMGGALCRIRSSLSAVLSSSSDGEDSVMGGQRQLRSNRDMVSSRRDKYRELRDSVVNLNLESGPTGER